MTVTKAPPTPFPPFVWPTIDTTISGPQLATQLNTRLKQLQATLQSLTAVAQGTANWTPVTSLAYPPKPTDQTLALNATSGNVSTVLPVSQSAPGKIYALVRTDASGHTAVATTQGADVFEPSGGTSVTVSTTAQAVQSDGQGHWWVVSAAGGGGGGGAVSSVFTRTGAVTAQANDYTFAQIGSLPTTLSGFGITDGLTSATAAATYAPLASPALTGTPTAPTATALTNSTQLATTAFVHTATAGGPFLPESGGTMTGIVTLDGVQYTLTLVNDTNYTPTVNDQIIVYTAITTTRLVILTNLNVGQRLEVWDGTSAGSAGTNNINFSVSGSVKVNGTTSGQITAVGFPNGYATAVQTAANTWAAQGAPIPNLPFSAGQITVTTQIKFNTVTLFTAGSSAPAVTINGGFELNSNTQTISGTLALTTGAPVFQLLTASGGAQIVTEPNTGGIIRYVANVGGANNLTLQVPSGSTVATVTPGHSIFYYVKNTVPVFNVIATT